MKKTISAVLVCVIIVCTLFALTSCGKVLTGKYEAETIIGDITYEFEIGGKVTMTTDPLFGKNETVEGEYEFNKDGDEITLTFNGESTTYEYVEGEEGGVAYIKLDGVKYTKAD